jgi:hypothetical protein
VNAEQRAPYLADIRASRECYRRGETNGYQVLCGMCRYFQFWPPAYGESYGDVSCEHPLATSANQGPPNYGIGPIPQEAAWEGGDCWGFRPTKKARRRHRDAA